MLSIYLTYSFVVPFFAHNSVLEFQSDAEDDLESQNEDDRPPATHVGTNDMVRASIRSVHNDILSFMLDKVSLSTTAWFLQPKNMPDWLYKYFGDAISPLILTKNGRALAKPGIFTDFRSYSPGSFWVHPPEPAITLSLHRYDPPSLYHPRVFLWLPHFFVETLRCPHCRNALEKNGALSPRRIIDVDDCFYIVTWAYYCRKGCKSHFHGWSRTLLDSLPAWLRLSFPATLSRKSGLS